MKDFDLKKYLAEGKLVNDLNEASITMDAFNRMEALVDRKTYESFINSLDDLLDDWYMEGFDKNDVVAYMEVIIPSN